MSSDVPGDNIYVGSKNVELSFKKLEDLAKASEERLQQFEEWTQQSEKFLISFAKALINDKELTMSSETRHHTEDLIKNFQAPLGGTEVE